MSSRQGSGPTGDGLSAAAPSLFGSTLRPPSSARQDKPTSSSAQWSDSTQPTKRPSSVFNLRFTPGSSSINSGAVGGAEGPRVFARPRAPRAASTPSGSSPFETPARSRIASPGSGLRAGIATPTTSRPSTPFVFARPTPAGRVVGGATPLTTPRMSAVRARRDDNVVIGYKL